MDALTLTTRERDGTATVSVAGEIDIATIGQLRRYVLEIVARGVRRVVLDMTKVSFIDAAGLGAMVGLASVAAQGGVSLGLGEVSAAVTRLVELTGLGDRFAVRAG
ncbi:STAS domain-containing protein [Nonomuraea sp. NPDC059023]|uniref:STAS domain-containing protein n=1 Tax=unclassified Nonomuraea TaxID=2593643 RepID=UPI0036C922EC